MAAMGARLIPMTKRRAVAALLMNPQIILVPGWRLLGAKAEERRYWREEKRRDAERLSHGSS